MNLQRTQRRTLTAVALLLLGSAQACGTRGQGNDTDFAALQQRGEIAMGVDQSTSTHRFDALPDGGRIEWQDDAGEASDVAAIRQHLKEITEAFRRGDFSTPFFIHQTNVPGTDVMTRKRAALTYTYADLPRGGAVRLRTSDAEVLRAIHEFMAFQRKDHRTGGHEH